MDLVMDVDTEPEIVLCNHCGKKFQKSYIRAHTRRYHRDKLVIQPAHSKIKCCLCSQTFKFRRDLRMHLHEAHGTETLTQIVFEMRSMEDFQEWLNSEQQNLKLKFIRRRQPRLMSDGCKHYDYYCQYDNLLNHSPIPEPKRKRALKQQGSYKLPGSCPAEILVDEKPEGNVLVQYYTTHIGHDMSLIHFQLSREDREFLAEKIKTGIPFDQILDEVKSNVTAEPKRLDMITRKTLHNVARTFNIEQWKRSSCDTSGVHAWIEELSAYEYNPVCYFKPMGEKHDDFAEHDLILIIITGIQAQVLKEFGQNIVCVDSTQSQRNQYDFQLTTLLVVDDQHEGFPVAYCFSNVVHTRVMNVFFQEIKSKAGIIAPRIFMSDDSDEWYNAWLAVMGNALTVRLLFTWHVDKDWRESLKKISAKKKDKQTAVYKKLRSLLQKMDKSEFVERLEQVSKDLMSDSDTQVFGRYFIRKWASRAECWAHCYHLAAGTNEDMHIENLHHLIREEYNNGVRTKRLDSCVDYLLRIVRCRQLQRIMRLTKIEALQAIDQMNAAHLRAMSFNNVDVEVLTEGESIVYQVKSETRENRQYRITTNNKTCPLNCDMVCLPCNVCVHIYSCICNDYLVNCNMCKHIHMLCSILQTNEETPSLLMSESADDAEGTCSAEPQILMDWKEDCLASTEVTDIAEVDVCSSSIELNASKNLCSSFTEITEVAEVYVCSSSTKVVEDTRVADLRSSIEYLNSLISPNMGEAVIDYVSTQVNLCISRVLKNSGIAMTANDENILANEQQQLNAPIYRPAKRRTAIVTRKSTSTRKGK